MTLLPCSELCPDATTLMCSRCPQSSSHLDVPSSYPLSRQSQTTKRSQASFAPTHQGCGAASEGGDLTGQGRPLGWLKLARPPLHQPLEQDSNRLNQKEDSQIWSFVIQDAGWGGGQHQMARPYSQNLRDRVIGSVASGRTCRATAALFGVSVASVVKWSQRWRVSGSAAAKRWAAANNCG